MSVRAGDNQRLERLCHYILRPPVAQDALELTPDGKVLLHLRRPWRDGTKAIRFEPNEFLEKLAAMVPRPRTNLVIYHGAFAPRGPAHVHATSRTGLLDGRTPPGTENGKEAKTPPKTSAASGRLPYLSWAQLLLRIFLIDLLACPDCGGRLRLVSTIEDPPIVEKIRAHLGLPLEAPCPSAGRMPEWLAGMRTGAEDEDQTPRRWDD